MNVGCKMLKRRLLLFLKNRAVLRVLKRDDGRVWDVLRQSVLGKAR